MIWLLWILTWACFWITRLVKWTNIPWSCPCYFLYTADMSTCCFRWRSGTPKKSWMVTFASEFVRKSLTGVRPDDPEAIPLPFVIIAIRCVSRIIHLCFSQSKPWFDTNCPPTCQGVTQWTNRTKPLTGGRYGALVHRRIAKWGLPDQHTVIWVSFQFLRSLSLWLKNRKLRSVWSLMNWYSLFST